MDSKNKIYRVEEEKLQSYAASQAVQAITPGLIIYGVLGIFLLGFGFANLSEGGSGLFQIFGFLTVLFLIILAVVGIGRQVTAESQMRKTIFIINDTEIRSFRDEGDKGIAGKITDGMIQARYGVKFQNDTTIPWNGIERTIWKKKGIDITGPSYDMYSGNGKIFVPIELDGYPEVKKILEQKQNHTTNG